MVRATDIRDNRSSPISQRRDRSHFDAILHPCSISRPGSLPLLSPPQPTRINTPPSTRTSRAYFLQGEAAAEAEAICESEGEEASGWGGRGDRAAPTNDHLLHQTPHSCVPHQLSQDPPHPQHCVALSTDAARASQFAGSFPLKCSTGAGQHGRWWTRVGY